MELLNDSNRALNSFFSQFNAMFRESKFPPSNILVFLFKTHTNSFYRIKVWFEEKIKHGDLKESSIGYHKAVKTVADMNVWESNVACEKIAVNIIEHLLDG